MPCCLDDPVGRRDDAIGEQPSGVEAQLGHVLRHLCHAVIGGDDDHGPLQADLTVGELQQVGDGAIELEQHVLALEAGRAEEVVDRVEAGEAHGEVIRDRVSAEVLAGDEPHGSQGPGCRVRSPNVEHGARRDEDRA